MARPSKWTREQYFAPFLSLLANSTITALARNAPPPADKEANLQYLIDAELENLEDGAIAAGTMGVMKGGGKVLRKVVGRGAAAEGVAAKGTRCSVAAKVRKLLGHNEYKARDAAKAARTKRSLLEYYKKYAKKPSITPVEGLAGAEIDTVTGEIRIGKELLEKYPDLVDGYLVEELRHFQVLHQQKMLGRAVTTAEEAALEQDIVDFMAREESGFKVFDPRKP
jgi:hypothetical protein